MRIFEFMSFLFTGKLFSDRERAQVRGEVSFPEAIAAHLAWKQRLIDALAGQAAQDLDCNVIGKDTLCTLGQWIHGAGKKRYGDLSSFVELREQHAHFYRIACDVVKLSRTRDVVEAKRLMDGEFQKTSADIVARLKHLSSLFS